MLIKTKIIVIFIICFVLISDGEVYSFYHQCQSASTICTCSYYDEYEYGWRTGVPYKYHTDQFEAWDTCSKLQTERNYNNLNGSNCSGLASNNFNLSYNHTLSNYWIGQYGASETTCTVLAANGHVAVVSLWYALGEYWETWECNPSRCSSSTITYAETLDYYYMRKMTP